MSFIDGKTETLCIYGSPVAHSKSPAMHNALFKALGINAVYVPYAPDPQNLETAIAGFRAMKFRGANVTIPYKSDVAKLVDEISPISQFTGSVNTLYWKDGVAGGTLCGTTTDPYGCIRNLEENGVKVQGKKVALLGNGGAAKAIAYTLLEQKNQLTIVCRSKEKGMDLAKNLEPSFGSQRCTVTTFDEFPTVSNAIDIIINATSVGMEPNIDQSPLDGNTIHSSQVVCDIVYAPPMTKLLKMAQAKGCKIVTGEGMLVHQGLESFKKWFPAETAGKTNEELTSIMRNGMRV
ncbi:MAG: shikimate dehydrogenase [Fibrobacteraceae bacterium]|nr:shikimate dehydrogenase [Fibrobacteraceae bacterium]